MTSNKVSRDQGPFLRLPKLAPDRPTSFTRTKWGDRGNSLPTRKWYNANKIQFSMFNGTSLVGGIHRDAVSAFLAMNHEMMQVDYHPIKGENWGGAYRTIRGGKSPSTHAFLVAFDVSSGSNPMSTRFHTDLPLELVHRWLSIKSVVSGRPAWVLGILWSRRPDPMHGQLQLAPAELVEGIECSDGTVFGDKESMQLGNLARHQEPPQTIFGMGSKHSQVKEIQRLLIKVGALPAGSDDGAYGHQTQEAVRKWQKRCGLPADGTWGPQTERKTREAIAALSSNAVPPRPLSQSMSRGEAVEAVHRAYRAELGRVPSNAGLRRWSAALAAGEVTEVELKAILNSVPEGQAYQNALSQQRVKEVTEAVRAVFIEQYGKEPTAKDLTIGVTKATNSLVNAWN